MLSFFRSIRRSLIAEGKTVKYLKYAVGEVLLVVIGILIALSVNNWNEDRKRELERLELVKNLENDFRTNLERLNEELTKLDGHVDGLNTFLEVVGKDSHQMGVGELQDLGRSGFRAVDFRPALSSYKTALSTGSIGLLNDNRLKELLIDFEEHYAEFAEMATINTGVSFLGPLAELRQELGTLRPLFNSGLAGRENFKISDQEFHNLISRNDVYAVFESKRIIRLRQQSDTRSMKETAEEILAALEAL